MRRSAIASLVSLSLSMTACAASQANAPAPASAKDAQVPVRIVPTVVAHKYAKTSRSVSVPFGAGQNGNELILGLLGMAQRDGAAYVSDIELALVFKWKGMAIECATKVVFPGDPALAQKAPVIAVPQPASRPAAAGAREGEEPTYDTEIVDFQPQLVEFLAVDQELFCEKKPHQVKVVRPRYDDRFDVEVGRPIEDVPMEKDVTVVWQEECHKRPVRRSVTRYDYEAKNGFVPVHWEYISQRYAEALLAEAAPLCYRVDDKDLGPHPAHHIRATVGYRGTVRQSFPLESVKPNPGVRGYGRQSLSD